MTSQVAKESLLSLAELEDHLGHITLCEAAADDLVPRNWEDAMSELAEVIQMPAFRPNLQLAKRSTFCITQRVAYIQSCKFST